MIKNCMNYMFKECKKIFNKKEEKWTKFELDLW